MGQFFILCFRVQQEYNSSLVNSLNRIFKSNLSLNNYNFKWLLTKPELSCVRNIIPRSRKRLWNGYPFLRPHWAAYNRIGNVWEYPPGCECLFHRRRGSPEYIRLRKSVSLISGEMGKKLLAANSTVSVLPSSFYIECSLVNKGPVEISWKQNKRVNLTWTMLYLI